MRILGTSYELRVIDRGSQVFAVGGEVPNNPIVLAFITLDLRDLPSQGRVLEEMIDYKSHVVVEIPGPIVVCQRIIHTSVFATGFCVKQRSNVLWPAA